jgi:GNAT superfamily N-acetyltransferase
VKTVAIDDQVTLRPFTPDDYAAVVAVANAVHPDYPETAEQWRWQDENRDPKCRWARVLAERDGAVVAFGSYGQSSGMYHPRKFHVDVQVLPEHRRAGVGAALYDAVVDALAPFDPVALSTDVRSDDEAGLRFAAARDFVEVMREQESELDLTVFDPAAFAGEVEKVEEQGIALRTAADLFAEDAGTAKRAMYELAWLVSLDIPHPDEQTKPEYEVWAKRFDNPDYLPEGNVYAIDTATGEYVGASMLWKTAKPGELSTGLTGVLRSHRKRGIATALKLKALTFAKENGWQTVKTWNEVNNDGMLGINFRLGFVRRPAWVALTRTLKEES